MPVAMAFAVLAAIEGRFAARDTFAGEVQADTGGLFVLAGPVVVVDLPAAFTLRWKVELHRGGAPVRHAEHRPDRLRRGAARIRLRGALPSRAPSPATHADGSLAGTIFAGAPHEPMHTLYVLSVWLHIVAAAVWIGSMAFFALVVAPVLRRPGNRERLAPFVRAMGARFRVLGWSCLGVLVATGASNLGLRGFGWATLGRADFWRTEFGCTLAYKLLLVAAVAACTVAHEVLTSRALAGPPQDPAPAQVVRRRAVSAWLGRATLLLSVLVVLLGVALVRGALW